MAISNPPANNPISGTATAVAGIEKTVIFATPFATKPHVALTPWGNYHVWLTGTRAKGFKFLNDHDVPVKVDWMADEA